MKAHVLQHWPLSANQTPRRNDKLASLANQNTAMAMTSGSILMVVAPSGAGKSSLVNGLLERDPSIVLSISCTTREPRPGEVDAEHYRFVSKEAFKAMRELLEWAEVHGNFYGTPRDRIEQATQNGHDVLLEIDWQGARQIKKHYPDAIGIFILPPSIEALETRLKKRGQDAPQVITKRLLAAGGEMSHASECQYVIINQEFSTALNQLSHIVESARLRYPAQATRHAELFSQLGISPTES